MRRSTLLAGGAAVALAAYAARRALVRPEAPVLTTNRAARTLELARIGGNAGAGLVAHKARRAFASDDRREALDAAYSLRTAEQVAEVLGGMKGALMKLGQMASFLDQGLPEPVREALAQLQADAPPMAAELARDCVARELGRPVTALFADWDDTPMAAASIGQVHRAVTAGGVEVAVKVQYPGVDAAIKADLDNAGLLIQVVHLLFPGMEPGPIVDELRARLTEELDYTREAVDQQRFHDTYAGHPFFRIPGVVPDLSARRVLTTRMASGVRFSTLETWSQAEQDLAGEAIYRFVFRSLWSHLMFNGDPHPGNYLFEPGGRVTFLDFGLVKHFGPGELDPLADMLRAAVFTKDKEALLAGAIRAGFLPTGARPDLDALYDYMAHFYEFVDQDREVTVTPEWSAESVRRYFDQSGGHAEIQRQLNVPGNLVIMQRINLGLLAVLGQLRATANWRRIAMELWPWLDEEAPPSTPMGEAEADWLRHRGGSKAANA
jgi:predicted unusual protein kinase regulating ubiquinone biosynthesis (AarF/ABC1/UbiB family)